MSDFLYFDYSTALPSEWRKVPQENPRDSPGIFLKIFTGILCRHSALVFEGKIYIFGGKKSIV
jgi:hypothetical protein